MEAQSKLFGGSGIGGLGLASTLPSTIQNLQIMERKLSSGFRRIFTVGYFRLGLVR